MMAKHNPFVGFYKVFAVIMDFAWGGAPVVEHQNPCSNPLGIKPIADGITAERGNEDVCRIEMLAPMQRHRGIGPRASDDYQEPKKCRGNFVHFTQDRLLRSEPPANSR